MSSIGSLNPMDFTKVLPDKNAKIAATEAKKLPPLSSYKANQIAAALHPSIQHLVVSKIIDEGKGVKTYILRGDKKKGTEKLAYFSAGQYISLTVEINGNTFTRPYSLSSSPSESTKVEYHITIKRAEGGLISNYILDNWKEKTEVDASAPLGTFTYEPLRDSKNIIGIAGGSGITPFRSLAHAIVDKDEDCSLTLIYGVKKYDEALFLNEFRALETKSKKFKIILVLSEETKKDYDHGFIDHNIIKKYAPKGEYSVFICGPQSMYNFLENELKELNLRKKFIRRELFGEMHNLEGEKDYVKPSSKTFKVTVRINGVEKTIEADAQDTLMSSLEKNGIKIPAHCRSGVCGWCHSQLISGEVYIPSSIDGRRLADKKYGYIHPCACFPLSDLVIDVPVK